MYRIVERKSGVVIEEYTVNQWEMALIYYDLLWNKYGAQPYTTELYHVPCESPMMYSD